MTQEPTPPERSGMMPADSPAPQRPGQKKSWTLIVPLLLVVILIILAIAAYAGGGWGGFF